MVVIKFFVGLLVAIYVGYPLMLVTFLRFDEIAITLQEPTSLVVALVGAVVTYLAKKKAGASAMIAVVAVLYSLLIYRMDSMLWTPEAAGFTNTALSGKVAVVTGANSGIGYATTLYLVDLGATVLMGCRSAKKCNQAAAEINSATISSVGTTVPMVFQLGDLHSVKDFAERILLEHDAIDILINNAGTGPMPGDKTTQGLEGGWGAMHLGHFALTKYLMPGLSKAKNQARIVNVASHAGVANAQIWLGVDDIIKGAGDEGLSDEWKEYLLNHSIGWGRFSPSFFEGDGEGDLRNEVIDGGFGAYARAKLSNILFTFELQRLIDNTPALKGEIAVNTLHTGAVDTGGLATLAMPHWLMDPCRNVAIEMSHYMWRRPRQGSLMTMLGAIGTDAETTQGGYFIDSMQNRIKPEHLVYADNAAAARLWDVSEGLLDKYLEDSEAKWT